MRISVSILIVATLALLSNAAPAGSNRGETSAPGVRHPSIPLYVKDWYGGQYAYQLPPGAKFKQFTPTYGDVIIEVNGKDRVVTMSRSTGKPVEQSWDEYVNHIGTLSQDQKNARLHDIPSATPRLNPSVPHTQAQDMDHAPSHPQAPVAIWDKTRTTEHAHVLNAGESLLGWTGRGDPVVRTADGKTRILSFSKNRVIYEPTSKYAARLKVSADIAHPVVPAQEQPEKHTRVRNPKTNDKPAVVWSSGPNAANQKLSIAENGNHAPPVAPAATRRSSNGRTRLSGCGANGGGIKFGCF
jgi:hypothetical protein